MIIKTSRAKSEAEVTIDAALCTGCGLCVEVCKGGPLVMRDGLAAVVGGSMLGCVGCGQCAAVCPTEAVSVTGRDLYPEDLLPFPRQRAGFTDLYGLMLGRRSVRTFQEREVEPELVEQILSAASTAPVGITPSDVGVLVLAGRGKVRAFRDDVLAAMAKMIWLFKPPAVYLMRPFMDRESYEMTVSFVAPVVGEYVAADRRGEDWFFYGAPLALAFYGTPYCDPADSFIPATYATLAAEALGLGSCMLGFPMTFLRYSGNLRKKYGLPKHMTGGLVVIFGYPAFKYHRAIRRRFGKVAYA